MRALFLQLQIPTAPIRGRVAVSHCQPPRVVEPTFSVASRADTAAMATSRAAVRALRPFVRSQRTANDAWTFGPGGKRPRAFLAELVKRPDNCVASGAYADGALTPGDVQFGTVRHQKGSGKKANVA